MRLSRRGGIKNILLHLIFYQLNRVYIVCVNMHKGHDLPESSYVTVGNEGSGSMINI